MNFTDEWMSDDVVLSLHEEGSAEGDGYRRGRGAARGGRAEHRGR